MLKGLMKIFLVRIINHVMVYTHKKFDDSEMVWESCKTKLIWLKLEESDKILRFLHLLHKFCASVVKVWMRFYTIARESRAIAPDFAGLETDCFTFYCSSKSFLEHLNFLWTFTTREVILNRCLRPAFSTWFGNRVCRYFSTRRTHMIRCAFDSSDPPITCILDP